ncbi:MAG: hypothetical protein WAQ28_06335 [Bacteroidia bacterium]|jgi:hypothetical protein
MKRIVLSFGALILLSVIIYYADWMFDDNHVDCFDNKFNHVLIAVVTMLLISIFALCFVLFYKTRGKE